MKAQELIEIGFDKISVSIEESGDKTSYYFYRLILPNDIMLTSSENDNVINDNWSVYLFELGYKFSNIDQIRSFIKLNKELTKCS